MVKQLFFLVFFFFAINVYSQNNKFCEQLNALKTLIETTHYSPKKINDSLSKGVYHLFIKNLDKRKELLTQENINLFKKDQYQIDDYINSNTCNFINRYTVALTELIKKSKQIIQNLENKTLDYSGKDTLFFKSNYKREYLKDENHAKLYWNKRIRYNIITKLIEDDSIYDNIKDNFKVLEQNIKPKVIQNKLCLLDEVLNQNGGVEQFVKESFFNAFLAYQDPNSSFFNYSNKTIFENSLANSQFTFGITTSKSENGDIVISYISPGSPAFQNINIEINDVIKSIQFKDNFLEMFCVSNEDVTSFINKKNQEKATFKIKKPNGLIVDVELTKKDVNVESNSIKGYIIESEEKIGYIEIPSFYTDLESLNGLGLANDVAKEIYKLKKENIEGLILDLRFNGGGSMKEASDLSGMFIDRGPLSIIKYRNGETYTIKDSYRGVTFSKPMVVLVNSFSASASEFFASVMQDYNRAIIVGTKTHGKSSAQVMLPLNEDDSGLGFSKLTVEKFYRPTGKSNQSIGIIPDIALPSLYSNLKTEESYLDYALSNDSVKVLLKPTPAKLLEIKKVKTLSNKRVLNSNRFKNISIANNKLIKNYINKNIKYPLTLEFVYNDIDNYKKIWELLYEKTSKDSLKIQLKNTASTNEIIQYNDSEKKNNDTILKQLSNDISIEEAYFILTDLININTNN